MWPTAAWVWVALTWGGATSALAQAPAREAVPASDSPSARGSARVAEAAPPGEPTVTTLAMLLDEFLAVPRAEALAGDALLQARLALRRARTLEAEGRAAARDRAVQIGAAALKLAAARHALALEREALTDAVARAGAIQRRAAVAREALERSLRDRARAREIAP